jgi:phage gp29-like protein
MIKQAKAALAKLTQVSKKGLETLQAGARSTQSTALNYASVNTLDPTRLANAFSQADQGYITDQATLFELVEEQDPHIFSELGKRRRAVTGLGWDLHPQDDATQAEIDRTKELKDMLCKIPRFEDAQYDLTDAIGKGLAALEFDWQTGSEWIPKALNWVPQRELQIDIKTGELMYVKNGMPEALRPWGWVVHEHRAKSGYIEQAALFRVLAWTYAYKAYNIRDMQRFLELYGMPIRLGKYPSGIGKTERDQLLKAVRNIGNDGAGIVPSTMAIEFITAQNGKIDDFINATEYWERKQSLAILGGTLTSQADGKTSTNALGVIHDKVRREIMLHDVRQIEPTLNSQIIKPIVLLNGLFTEDRIPVLRYDTADEVDQKAIVDVLKIGAELGMEIDLDWAHEALQIPRAGKEAKILSASGRTAAPNQAGAALTRLAALAKQQTDGDIVGNYSQQLAALCMPHEEAAIQQIAAVVAAAGSFDEAIAGIEALNLSGSTWAESLQLGLAAAHLAGRGDIGGTS